eukprot:1074089-Rhodomonas_salina.2
MTSHAVAVVPGTTAVDVVIAEVDAACSRALRRACEGKQSLDNTTSSAVKPNPTVCTTAPLNSSCSRRKSM